jgi:two-component sensor histidine kinase
VTVASPAPRPVGGAFRVSLAFPDCARDCRLRSEADHRIANHLTMLSSYARMKCAEFKGEGVTSYESVRLLNQSIEAQICAISRLHRMLTWQAGSNAVELAPLLHEICGSLVGDPEQRVILVEDLAPDCAIGVEHVLAVGQIVGEAIINAYKYAFPASAAGVVLIRSRRTGQGAVCVDIIDNGPGLPAAFDPEADGGFGFNLMRSLSRGLRAPLDFVSSPNGLRVTLTLPLARGLAEQPHVPDR